MSEYTHIVRLEQISNPANFVESKTNKPKNRTKRLYDNYRAANGLIDWEYHERFDSFNGVPESDIRLVVLARVYTKTF